VGGIRKGKRHTERYQQAVTWAAENFSDLTQVRRAYRCSASFLYKAYYTRLERKLGEKLNYPWPTTIGIDEHAFKKCPKTGLTQFVSMIVDHNNERVRELVDGKKCDDLKRDLAHIPGRENVKNATIDMCDPFKKFVREFFPNAELIADKFHVLRLLSPSILKRRKEITGDRASAKARRLLLMSAKNLDYSSKLTLFRFLQNYPELKEVYDWKERVHGFYRIKGYNRACIAFTHMTDAMADSKLQEIKTLRRTLMKWRIEILNYFKTGLTNARTEGFNNKAKVVKRRGYGYKSFRNYRLKVLTACC
jgi:transposase